MKFELSFCESLLRLMEIPSLKDLSAKTITMSIPPHLRGDLPKETDDILNFYDTIHVLNVRFMMMLFKNYIDDKYDSALMRIASLPDYEDLDYEEMVSLVIKEYHEMAIQSYGDYDYDWDFIGYLSDYLLENNNENLDEFTQDTIKRDKLLGKFYRLAERLMIEKIVLLNNTGMGGVDFCYDAQELYEQFPYIQGIIGWYTQDNIQELREISLMAYTTSNGSPHNSDPLFIKDKIYPIAQTLGIKCDNIDAVHPVFRAV